ncbi:DUF882 domain-containing protein [Azospirillum sp. A39]|uniref:DUF882 domain-containing protein n=2 Tax=unclassified Azospirillum TaxID=2630922 RepID=UPI0040466082
MPAVPAMAALPAPPKRRLVLHNVNTGEHFDEVYWTDGAYRPEVLRRLDRLLRDHRDGQVARFDPRLFDLVSELHRRMGSGEPFKVICGYRSKHTNALARRRSRGVAKESYHTRAMAMDIALPDRSLKGLAQEAKALKAGGVGVYGRSGFVHVDVGPVRTW